MLLADGGRVIGRTLKHELPNYGTFDEKRVFAPGPLPEPIEFRGVKIGVPDLRGHLAGGGLRASRRSRRRDAAGAQRQPLRARQGRDPLAAGARARARRPGCRSPISTASAARTSWCSTARPSSCIPTASSSSRCPTGTRRCWSPTGRAGPTAGAARRAASTQLDPFPGDVYRAMMVGLRDYVGAQRLSRRDPRPVGRHRQRALGRGRGRCARRRQGLGRDAPVEIHQRRKPRGRPRVRPAARLPP